MLWSFVTLDFKGMKANAKDAFGGLSAAVKDATNAGWDYAKSMDDINDREVAAANRMTKLRVDIETLKNKAEKLSGKEKLAMLKDAMDKEIELNGIETGFLAERNAAETSNLASKIQNDKLSLAQKEEQLKKWLAIDDKGLAAAMENDAAFAEFENKNEEEFQKLQKTKADEIMKQAELQTGTRRLQNKLATEEKEELTAGTKAAKEAAEKQAAAEKIKLESIEAANNHIVASINKRHLEGKTSEDQYNADLLEQDLIFLQCKMDIYKAGSKNYEDSRNQILEKQVKAEQVVKDLLLKAGKELEDSKISNLKEGVEKEKAIENQYWADELSGLKKQLLDKETLSADEIALNDVVNKTIEEKTKAHNKAITDLTISASDEKKITDLNDSILHAQTQKQKWDDEEALAKVQYDQEFKAAEGNRQKELDAEKSYKDKLIGIRTEQNQEYKIISDALTSFVSDAFSGQLDEYASFGESLILMALQILKQLIPIWAAQIVGGSLATPDSILTGGTTGIIKFTAMLAIMEGFVAVAEAGVKSNINSKKEKAQAKKGKQSGGYADSDSNDSTPVGVYHANEFIASGPAVRNPTIKPVLDIIDIAQRSGTIRSLNLPAMLGQTGRQSGGYASSSPGNESSIVFPSADPEQKAINKALSEELKFLRQNGIKATFNNYGRNSLSEALDKIDRFKTIVHPK